LAIYCDDEDYIFYNCGTPGYISPETINSKKNKVTPKSDIFSAGVILYILLKGHFLFESKNAKEVMIKNKNMDFNLDNLK
jgi:serine/threonine protein kinase